MYFYDMEKAFEDQNPNKNQPTDDDFQGKRPRRNSCSDSVRSIFNFQCDCKKFQNVLIKWGWQNEKRQQNIIKKLIKGIQMFLNLKNRFHIKNIGSEQDSWANLVEQHISYIQLCYIRNMCMFSLMSSEALNITKQPLHKSASMCVRCQECGVKY